MPFRVQFDGMKHPVSLHFELYRAAGPGIITKRRRNEGAVRTLDRHWPAAARRRVKNPKAFQSLCNPGADLAARRSSI